MDASSALPENTGVEGNARLTAALGALLLVAVAVEGVTIFGVRQMLTLHVFVGLFLVPVVVLKLTTTGYRFMRYYRGTEAYVRKGPPHVVLRIAAPFVVVSTIMVLGSGITTLAVGPRHSGTWLTIHQGSVIAWSALTAIHLLGHAVETWKLTTAELRSDPAIPRRGARAALVAGSLVVGLSLGVASLGWTDAWTNPRHRAAPTSDTPHR